MTCNIVNIGNSRQIMPESDADIFITFTYLAEAAAAAVAVQASMTEMTKHCIAFRIYANLEKLDCQTRELWAKIDLFALSICTLHIMAIKEAKMMLFIIDDALLTQRSMHYVLCLF